MRSFLSLVVILACGTPSMAQIQRAAHTRSFRVDSDYAAGVSISPRGSVFIKNSDGRTITWFNGFSRGTINAPSENPFRVYESRSTQLWSLYSDGIMMYFRGQWKHYPIQEIRQELATNPLRSIRQIPLTPVDVNRVLVLLSDRFLLFDAGAASVTVLKLASDTQLGRFLEMQESPDGMLWISGTHGLAKVRALTRRIGRETPWMEFIAPDPKLYRDFQRPFEDVSGTVTTVCSASGENGLRYIVHLTGGAWSFNEVGTERPRQAWRAWDGMTWAFTFNSVFRLDLASDGRPRIVKESTSGANFDVAVQPNGVFWIASTEGLIRYAPFTWRSPAPLHQIQTPVHAMLFEAKHPAGAWLATSEGLIRTEGDKLDLINWPENFEAHFQASDEVYHLPNGSIAVTSAAGPLVFDPTSRNFTPLTHPGGTLRVLGQFQAGGLCLKQAGTKPINSIVLLRYDGTRFDPFLESQLTNNLEGITLFREGRNGDLWFAGEDGLFRYRTSTKTIETFHLEDGLNPSRVTCLEEIAEDRIWVGSGDRLLELRGNRWEPLLNSVDRVNSITRTHDSGVWIATGAGVFRHLNGGWIQNAEFEGLSAPNILKLSLDPAGQVWAGTARGISKYFPEADQEPPRTFEPIVVHPDQPSTAEPTMITFSGADRWSYSEPAHLLFAYKLDEGPWSLFSSANSKTFPSLPSGSRRLEIRAMDRNGNVDPNSKFIEFAVIVPWFLDPRLIGVSVLALAIILVLAGLAVNRHWQLKRSYARVEQMVAQRTRELEKANQELLHSHKMRAIGTMASGIAHDFNSILSIIKGSAEIIESNLDDREKIRTRVSRIQTVVEQGSTIVRALLGLGRLNEQQLTECDPGSILEGTRRLLADRIPPGVELVVWQAPGVPSVTCAVEVLQQIVMNLVLNAFDALTRNGQIRLQATTVSEPPHPLVLEPEPAPLHIALSVEDTGSGISPENLTRIFEPFFTTKAFSSRRGTGLGLSMVYELAKGMGYGLAVRSTAGSGSTFTVFVPAKTQSPITADDSIRPKETDLKTGAIV